MRQKQKRPFTGLRSVDQGLDLLFAERGGALQAELTALWANWGMVLGDDLACLGAPLGHKDKTLTIGAEDSMALQELSLQSDEILERVNAFLTEPHFERVRVTLMLGSRDLRTKRPARSTEHIRIPLPPRPTRLGALIGKFPEDSLIAKCYAAYVRIWEK